MFTGCVVQGASKIPRRRYSSRGGSLGARFFDLWLWAMFLVCGLLLVLVELVAGVVTRLDLAVVASVLVVAGLVTLVFYSAQGLRKYHARKAVFVVRLI